MLSRDEAASLPRISKNFDAIDANHDGLVTFEELRAFHAQHKGGHGHRGGMKALDKDGDGRISREEAEKQVKDWESRDGRSPDALWFEKY